MNTMKKMNIFELMDYLEGLGWSGEQINLYVEDYYELNK